MYYVPPQTVLLLTTGQTSVQMLIDKMFGDTYRTHRAFNCNTQTQRDERRAEIIRCCYY